MIVTSTLPKQNTVELYAYIKETIRLQQAITDCIEFLDGAIGLFYSPKYCCFGKVNRQTIVTWYELQQGKKGTWQKRILDWDSVFEAKIFTKTIELRWLNIPNEGGRAVLLSEKEIANSPFEHALPVLEGLQFHSQTYLLWGEGLGKDSPSIDAGWNTLATARIGMMSVPIASAKNGQPVPLEKGQSVLLRSREYFGLAPGMAGEEHGNVSVVEERLIGLSLGVRNGKE